MQGSAGGYTSYIIWAVLICVVLALRLRTMNRARRLRLETLWIIPAIYGAFTAFLLYEFPLHGLQWFYGAIALGAGGLVGWRRGMLMQINVDPDSHALNQRASPAAILFILAILLVRRGLVFEAGAMGLNVGVLTDLLVLFVLGMFSVARLAMFLRARRMLRAHLAETFS